MGKRFIADFQAGRTDEEIRYIVTDYLSREGFSCTNYKGEEVWKKGVGALTAPQFLKVNFQNGRVHLEAWLKYALLPGVYCGEMGLTGFVGIAVKKPLKARVDMLISILQQPGAVQPGVAQPCAVAQPGAGQAPTGAGQP